MGCGGDLAHFELLLPPYGLLADELRAICGVAVSRFQAGVMQFRGREKMAVDAKGRTSVPARFRDLLDAHYPVAQARHLIVVPWFDGNLRVFPLPVWEAKQDAFDGMFQEKDVFALDELDSDLRRFLYGMAQDLMIDGQGRVLLSQDLREHAGLGKEVYWVSVGSMLEIWDPSRLSGRFETDRARQLREALQERLRSTPEEA